MSSIQGVRHAEIVGAPTFPKWNSGIADTYSPVAQAFRPEVFPLGGMVVAPGTKTLARSRGELQNLAIGQNSGHSPRVVRP